MFQRILQYIQPASQPQTTCSHTSPGPPHHHLNLQDCLKPATRTAAATIDLPNPKNSAQTIRNCLREAHLHSRRPHRGLDLTAVRRRNRLEWANAHIRWRLALWRGVLFTDESRFADVKVVDRVAHGGGGVMICACVCYEQTNTGAFY